MGVGARRDSMDRRQVKVISITKAREPRVDPEMVASAERMLELIKAGKVQSMVFIGVGPPDRDGTESFYATHDAATHAMIGAMTLHTQNLVDELRETIIDGLPVGDE